MKMSSRLYYFLVIFLIINILLLFMTDDTFAYDSKQMERCRQSEKCKGKLVEICEKNLNANLYKYKELRRVAMQTYRGLLDLHPNNMAKNTFQLTLLEGLQSTGAYQIFSK